MNGRLKKWEMALALSLCITLCHGIAFPAASGCSWWGVIFPGLTEYAAADSADAVKLYSESGGVELRWQMLDWIRELTGRRR